MRTGVLLAVALLLATACGGAGDDEDAGAMTGELSYVRSGGFAGAHDRLTVQSDGSAEVVVRGHDAEEFRLSEDELDALMGVLDGARLGDLSEDSTSEPPAPDAFLYEISYGEDEVRTDDPSAPSELRPLLTELDRIVDEHRPR